MQQLQHSIRITRIAQQAEIILLHPDLFNLMAINFQLHTIYKYQYQRSLFCQSINDRTSETQFNNLTFESTTSINTTIATLSYSNNQSSNKYTDHGYESLEEENIALFMAIFQHVELITDYVIFDKILYNTILENTTIAMS